MRRVAGMFGLHPLAVEDSLTGHQRPKVEPYDDMLFVVLKTLWYVDERDEVETGQVAIFLGRDFVVTVRQGTGVVAGQRARATSRRASTSSGSGPPPWRTPSATGSSTATRRSPRSWRSTSTRSRSRCSPPTAPADTQRIYVLKREVAEVRRAVQPLRVPHAAVRDGDLPVRAGRVRALLPRRRRPRHAGGGGGGEPGHAALDARSTPTSPGSASSRTRTCGRSPPGWRSPAVGTLVAGVYGMNFDHMPELHWRFGYALALGLMACSSVCSTGCSSARAGSEPSLSRRWAAAGSRFRWGSSPRRRAARR